MVLNYTFMEGVTYEEKEVLWACESNLFSIGIITLRD
jgi:hypothetical protein